MKLCAASLSDAIIFIPSEILVLETEIILWFSFTKMPPVLLLCE